jgi:hypothetical protein
MPPVSHHRSIVALQPDQQHPFWKFVIRVVNARVHMSKIVAEHLEIHRLRRVGHLPYAPDLAYSYFFLFVVTKGQLKGIHFLNGQEPVY